MMNKKLKEIALKENSTVKTILPSDSFAYLLGWPRVQCLWILNFMPDWLRPVVISFLVWSRAKSYLTFNNRVTCQ